ncbi:Ig-like domain-containing protein [candidate division KSB1 bacterium]|nr:Ig-like domain-containing protein [candidate division KSB1 bacterium]
MLHLARHRELVVGILRLMMSLCVGFSVGGLNPAPLLAAGAVKASWNANTELDLAGYKIYYGLSSGNYTISINVGNVTQYTVNQLAEGLIYYFVVTAYDTAGNESAYSQEVSAELPLVDRTPPSVSNVRLINPTTVELLFSEPVANASAQTKSNYTIDKGIVVVSATLQADTRTVNLTTSAHAAGETYSLTVRNVADRATPANVMSQAKTFTYTYQVEDQRPPEVNSVTLTDQTHVLIVFNEPITLASAENAGNYSISDGVQVFEARLAGNGLEVTLLASAHQYNKDYNIVIRNIKDRSPAANTIKAGTIITYFLFNDAGDDGSGLSVNGLKPARYTVDSLQVGSAYYIDRPYVVRQIPNSKHGLLWIKTASADRNGTGEPFIEFTLTRESNIYVAYDSRAQQPPDWLRNYFTPTNEFITVSENNIKLKLWKQHSLPGSVVLGGNMAGGVQAGTSLSMYVVLVEDVQAPPTTNSPAPQSFVLFQNYPNPFSATGSIGGISRTTIRYYLQEQHQVVLTVHNKLGQVVRELNSGLMPAGYHNLTWDGRDDSGKPLPSGNYLCTLEVRDEFASVGLAMSASLNRQTKVITLLK